MSLSSLLFTAWMMTIRHVQSRSTDTLSAEDYPIELEMLPSACNDLPDGFHWIRPLVDSDDQYPNIYVKCHNGYTMLNPSLFDFFSYHHIKALFTSYSEYVHILHSAIYHYA